VLSKKQYYPEIDGIRAISILAVILIHTTTKILEVTSPGNSSYLTSFFLNQISRFAVPLFFLISGFVLELNYENHQSYLSYLKKRLAKIALPYIFWSAIYYFLIYTWHGESFFKALTLGTSSYQLYFIPSLLIFYFIFPFFHRFFKIISQSSVFLPLAILQFAILGYDYYFQPLNFAYPINIALLNFFVFILGMIISRKYNQILSISTKNIFNNLLFSTILGISVFLEGYFLYFQTHNYLKFYSQWRPSILIYSLSLFSVLIVILKSNNLTNFLSKHSFFTFFIHVLVLEVIWNNLLKNISTPLVIPIFFISVTTISYYIAYICHKVPFISKITG